MARWQLQHAKQQFSRVVELAATEGPQHVTRNGKEVVVVVDVDEYRRLTSDDGAFKRFLVDAPDLGALPVERDRAEPRVVDL